MIASRCYECCHERVCSYKQELNNAVESVLRVSYSVDGNRVKLLKNSDIVVELKCPHYMSKYGGESDA